MLFQNGSRINFSKNLTILGKYDSSRTKAFIQTGWTLKDKAIPSQLEKQIYLAVPHNVWDGGRIKK